MTAGDGRSRTHGTARPVADSGPAQPDDQPDSAWMVAGRGDAITVGPARSIRVLADRRCTVSIDDALAVETLATQVTEHEVAESGLRSFTVPWHGAGDGRTVAVNPAGGNRVSWDFDRTDFRLTPAKDGHLTSVYVRFVLRHITTDLLATDAEGRSIHAVVAPLRRSGGDDTMLAVVGPTTSGKTRMVNQLLVAGLLGAVLDDDCPVLIPGGELLTLVPRRYEVARAVRSRLGAVVLLGDGFEPGVEGRRAREFLESTTVPWPAPWLPAARRRPAPQLPATVPVIEVAARDTDAWRIVMERASADGWGSV